MLSRVATLQHACFLLYDNLKRSQNRDFYTENKSLFYSRLFLGYAFAVDGGPVVLHGNGNPIKFLAEGSHVFRLFDVAVFALGVVTAEHEGEALVGIVARYVFRHAGVAGAVAEGENRLHADFLRDDGDLVHLEILDNEFAAQYQLIVIVKDIRKTVRIALVRSDKVFVGTDDLSVGNIQRRVANNAADDKSVGAADDVDREVICLQILNDLQHGLVPALAALHAV